MSKESALEYQISKIEKLAQLKADEMEAKNYEKYHHMYDMVVQFLKTQDVLLYGGYAINELMPKKDKIYKENALPDIDIFSPASLKVAKAVVRMFKQRGIEIVNFSEALHPGTYKVYVQGIQIVDITGMSKRAYRKLHKRSVMGPSGLRVVDPQFLRLSLHMILSQSNNADRWPKVFARLAKFYKHFPPTVCKTDDRDEKELPTELVEGIYAHLRNTPYVVFGSKEIEAMLGNRPVASTKVPWIQIVADRNVNQVANEIVNAVPTFSLKTSQVFGGDDFVSNHVFITFKGRKVIGIYSVDACVSFNTWKGLKVATIHTMLRMYLSMMLSTYKHFEIMTDQLECMVNALAVLQQTATSSKRKLLQQLVIECFGSFQGLITLKRERVLRMINK